MKLEPRTVGLTALAAATIALAGVVAWRIGDALTPDHITIVAGSSTGESFQMLKAAKEVAERHDSSLRISVESVPDPVERQRRLESGQAQFAAIRADADLGPDTRVVAVLFRDFVQLMATDSRIQRFTDLKGKRVAVVNHGPQFVSFLALAQYYGLTRDDIEIVGMDEQNPDLAAAAAQADAIFHVRALHNGQIEKVAATGRLSFVPLEQGAGIHKRMPSYSTAVIPRGTYSGRPEVPAADTETLAVRQVLLARPDVDDGIVQTIASVLIGSRAEMGAALPPDRKELQALLGEIRQPTEAMELGVGIHPGAEAEFRHRKAPFVRTHADVVAAVWAAGVLFAGWLWFWRKWIRRQERARLDNVLRHLSGLIRENENSTTMAQAAPVEAELRAIRKAVVRGFDEGRLSQSSLRAFHGIWRQVNSAARERRKAIRRFSGVEQPPVEEDAPRGKGLGWLRSILMGR